MTRDGGSTQEKKRKYIESGADLSEDGRYRYRLWRVWDPEKAVLPFVMLNPSTADAMVDDPTIRKCVGFAKHYGYGILQVCNLFALRSRNPEELRRWTEPSAIGPRNDEVLAGLAQYARRDDGHIIVAWGGWGDRFPDRVARVHDLLRGANVVCLGRTASGQPLHPLMLSYERDWQPYEEVPDVAA